MPAILVVEDDPNQRLLLEEELEEEGYTVFAAPDASAALALIKGAMPDLVVLDLAMPGMDGLELLGRLLGKDRRLPVIIHSAYTSYREDRVSWAADAYVVKRSDLGPLKSTIRDVLAEHRRAASTDGAQEHTPRA